MSVTDSTTPNLGNPSTEGAAPPVEPPATVSAPAEPMEPEGGEGAPTPAYLDPEQYGSHLVKVTVQGNEVELPFSEAIKGVMLQRDYTQKTQDLAEDKRKLQQADALVSFLEANPQEAIKQLADIYDLDLANELRPIERSPDEQRLIEMQRQMAAQQEAITRQQIENEIAAIRAEHGDFDVRATAQFAQERGVRLREAFDLMQYEQIRTKQAEQAQQEQRRQAALAAQVAHQGTSTQRGTVQPGSNKPVSSLRDAWELAKTQTK